MKNKLFSVLGFAMLMALLVQFSACEKDEDGNLKLKTKMTAKIDGLAWTANVRNVIRKEDGFNITGTSLDGKVITVEIFGTEVKEYTLSILPPSAGCGAVYKASVSASTDDAYISATGSVNLTKVDETAKSISGTFSFVLTNTAVQTVSITEGQFTDLIYLIDNSEE